MSQENIDALKRLYANWARGDFRSDESLFAPDVVSSWVVAGSPMAAQDLQGLVRNLREFLEQWSEFRAEAGEFIEIQENAVLVVARQYTTGKQSGVELEATLFHTWVFRGNKVVQYHAYFDRDEALTAAGLKE